MHAPHSVRATLLAGLVLSACQIPAMSSGRAIADELQKVTPLTLGIPGGLCVQIGAGNITFASRLAQSGRFLVHLLDADWDEVHSARIALRKQKLYGLASVEKLGTALPYTENLVNLLVLSDSNQVSSKELSRVVCPNGVVLAAPQTLSAHQLQQAGFKMISVAGLKTGWVAARKPRPQEMDQWSHPRHAADGNAVSNDLIVGPPRRVRWLAGPWQEISTMVTADGRNYYGGMWVRDSYNGLRLWDRRVTPTPARGGYSFRPVSGSASPVAGDGKIFLYTDGVLTAVAGATGRTIRTYPVAGKPRTVLYNHGTLITVDVRSVRAFDVEAGRLIWKHDAAEPRLTVAGDDVVAFVSGRRRRGGKTVAILVRKSTGEVLWQKDNLPWLSRATRCVYHNGLLAFEVSTLNNDGPGNSLHIVATKDGTVILNRDVLPGMNHMRQVRPLFVGDKLWLLHGGKDAQKKRLPTQVSSIDLLTGKATATYSAGLTHCFPPVATTRYLFAGELDLTDLRSGRVDANHISKAACGRDSGWVPANGLIYITPKHCVCWPMLRGYSALAPARPGGSPVKKKVSEIEFPLETLADAPAVSRSSADDKRAWPVYRHDAWRSGSTQAAGPSELRTLWTAELGPPTDVTGPIIDDWAENHFVKGPITPPVIARGLVFLARPDAQEIVALDAASGKVRWRFTTNGRVDSPPTIYRGLCLFGSKNGFVYCLRADDGHEVWRLQAAPLDERIVTYGGLESPWPVPGSVLVVDETAYFAAGRQSLADGGILIFAVDPVTGYKRWVTRLNTVPQKGFYESSGLEFDNFDLLFQQGTGIAMSRWVFDRQTGKQKVNRWDAFARLNTGGGAAWVPQGSWSYAPRNRPRTRHYTMNRPLVVFRDNVVIGCRQGMKSVYRRDFDKQSLAKFNPKWMTGWAAGGADRKGKTAWRSQRLSEGAKWSHEIYSDKKSDSRTINALAMAKDHIYLAGSDGIVRILAATTGKTLTQRKVSAPLWDGLAIANGQLFVATQDGQILCLGKK